MRWLLVKAEIWLYVLVCAPTLPIAWALYGINRNWAEWFMNPMLRWNAAIERRKGGCLHGSE